MQYTRNILKVYDQATHEEISQGIRWYETANRECQRLADTYGLSLDTVVGVVSALSPNNRWSRNIQDAETLIQTYLSGKPVEEAVICTYKAMRQKAWDILLSDGPREKMLAKLNGQKIQTFARCILGEPTCVIDGHAYNIAHNKRVGLTDGTINISKRLYKELQYRYGKAAKLRMLEPFEMQAATWLTWRRICRRLRGLLGVVFMG